MQVEDAVTPVTSAERVQRLLAERARRLAQEEASPGTAAEGIAILQCRVQDERYAVPLRVLEAVRPAVGLVPVPCTPPFVAGILNVRGEIVSVLDCAAALGLPGTPAEHGDVLLLRVRRGALHDDAGAAATRSSSDTPSEGASGELMRLGLLVDEVLGVEEVAEERLVPPLSGNDFTRSIAGTATTFLEVERLLAGGRFEVMEDVT